MSMTYSVAIWVDIVWFPVEKAYLIVRSKNTWALSNATGNEWFPYYERVFVEE